MALALLANETISLYKKYKNLRSLAKNMIMLTAPLLSNAADKLKNVDRDLILDIFSEKIFDEIARLVAYICNTPTALINLVDAERQYFRSKAGLAISEIPWNIAFCAHTILQPDLFIVRDACQDIRFVNNPLVTSTPKIRFYAGVPLITSTGTAIGTLCVIDYLPRDLSPEQKEALQTLARQVVDRFELRRDLIDMTHAQTECKRANETLRLLESVVVNANDAVIITEAEPIAKPGPRIVYANKAFTQMTGYSLEEVLGKTPRILQGAKTDPAVLEKIRMALKAWQPVRAELINYHKDGSEFWVEINIVPIADRSGWYTHWISVQRDITERKQAEEMQLRIKVTETAKLELETEIAERRRAEEALQKSFATNRALLDAIPDWIFRIAKDGTLVNFKAAKDIRLPLAESEFLGKNLYSVLPQEICQPMMAYIQQALSTGEMQVFEYQLQVNDDLLDYEARIAVSAEDEVMAIVRDITKRKQAERDIRDALEQQKELSELRSRFVTMASHDFRTPLTTILSSTELLEHYNHKFTEEKKLNHLRRIRTSVHHMTSLLNDVLLISKAEAGKLEFKPTLLNLEQFCLDLVEEIQLSASDRQIIFRVQGESIDAYMDEKLLRHIFSNLLSNAVKYSSPGGTVLFELIYQQKEVILCIQDEGIGIPPTDQTQLFNSFHRASNVGAIAGTGLGLAIVKKSVDLHGGQIIFASAVGVGTTFRVTLPID